MITYLNTNGIMNREFSKEKESQRLNQIRKQIWDALKEGKHLNIVSAQELCGTRDLRSNISVLRKRIDEQNLPYRIVDKWVVINPYTRIKEYWLEEVAA